MHAVVQTGGKQYRVTAGSIIEVEKLSGEAGEVIALASVLAISDGKKTVLGSPLIADAKVSAEILSQGKGEKVIIFKKKRRQKYRRKNGHRQFVTTLHITNIEFKGESLASADTRGATVKVTDATKKPVAKPAAKTASKPAAAKAKPATTKKPAAAKKPAASKAKPSTAAKKPAATKKAADKQA
jgi:large subunit ribosomal protein L21